MAGTTGLEPAASAVTGQRSNQLNYVPTLFSYLYRKPASLVAFLRFNRFACVACFNPVEPNSEVNGHHGHHAKPLSKNCATGKHQPRAAVPAPSMNCSRGNSDQYRRRLRTSLMLFNPCAKGGSNLYPTHGSVQIKRGRLGSGSIFFRS